MSVLFRQVAICLFLLFPLLVKADTFIVTSNQDSGPGTLRAAILASNANGTATTDYIHFNLPNTTWNDRTIVFTTSMPAIAGNLVIDGTTQPGAQLDKSEAGVILMGKAPPLANPLYGIYIDKADHVEIYGLAIFTDAASSRNEFGIYVTNSGNITIGAPGKGNVIARWWHGIQVENCPTGQITIQSNIIGTSGKMDPPTDETYCTGAIETRNVGNLLIGGPAAAAGNVLFGRNICNISQDDGNSGRTVLSFNKVCLDRNGAVVTNFFYNDSGFSLYGKDHAITISDNQMSRTGIFIAQAAKPVLIVRNRIGTDMSGQNKLDNNEISQVGIQVLDCKQVLIGGSAANANYIAGRYSAVVNNYSYNTTVSHNSLFCNGDGINIYGWDPNAAGRPAPFANVTGCNGSTITGKATPNSKIEVYESDNCALYYSPGNCGQKIYVATITADNNGDWSFPASATVGYTFGATDAYGCTSEFSTPLAQFISQTNTACGKRTGSVIMKVQRGYIIGWRTPDGTIVSRDTSLTNMPAGRYVLEISSGSCNDARCIYTWGEFQIGEESPAIETDGVVITDASCGQKNGSIKYLRYTGMNRKITWKNAAGQMVEEGEELIAAAPGAYTVTIEDIVNNCSATAGPFTITNLNGPTLDLSGVVVTPATCAAPNGSITGAVVTGTGNITYTWLDHTGKQVGNDAALKDVKAGKYVLRFSDGSGCTYAESDTIVVPDAGIITVDDSKIIIKQAGCDGRGGQITGLSQTGATKLEWLNEEGQLVGNDIDLINVVPGVYRLVLSNNYCRWDYKLYGVTQAVAPKATLENITVMPPHCGQANGSLTDPQITGVTPVSYRWVDEDNAVVSNTAAALDLPAGTYRLIVTDVNGCESEATTQLLQAAPPPQLDVAGMMVKPDNCNTHTGSITGIRSTGAGPLAYTWCNGTVAVGQNIHLPDIPSGTYQLSVTDKYGCTVKSDAIQVGNADILAVTPKLPDYTITAGMEVLLQVSNPEEGMYYLYNPAVSGQPVQQSATGSFLVRGLTHTSTFLVELKKGSCLSPRGKGMVTVLDGVKIYPPTAFTPNGDGQNDLFRIRAFGLKAVVLTVYSRWGQVVFTTQDLQRGWDGTHQNLPLPAGDYVWMLKAVDIAGQEVQKSGSILLIR